MKMKLQMHGMPCMDIKQTRKKL